VFPKLYDKYSQLILIIDEFQKTNVVIADDETGEIIYEEKEKKDERKYNCSYFLEK
jgi:hypothetical protein